MRERAFLQLFDDHHAALFRFAYRLTNSSADAEDIVQECFLEILRPGNSYDRRRARIRAYLYGVVRNQWLKRRRNASTADPGPDPIDDRSPESDLLASEAQQAIVQAIGKLPDTQREALILAHYEQLPLSEIAAILEIEVGAVKSRLERARARLRESLAAHAPPQRSAK
ncbi:MAG TPA: RNA polymerase sigma factor [Bryobacteraceae bacterium]|nr:RNA polymerase sigma factor [Bryobacteraceae bacterium]